MTNIRRIFILSMALIPLIATSLSATDTTPDQNEKTVFFVKPADGAVLSSPVKVVMGVKGMSVQKAGTIKEGTGHHHIIVNGSHIKSGQVVPADEQHIHFGGGQTETDLTLPKGEHTLTLQFADGSHKSYGQELSRTIKITVQ